MSEQPRPVAFLGLGALGLPMAANLLATGFPLTVHNRSSAREDSLRAAGARCAATPADAVRAAELICLCLSDEPAVRQVLLGDKPGESSRGSAIQRWPGPRRPGDRLLHHRAERQRGGRRPTGGAGGELHRRPGDRRHGRGEGRHPFGAGGG